MGWTRFALGRAALAALTLVVLSALVFWATEVLPGDAVGVLSGSQATDVEREQVRQRLGLDQPAAARYASWATAAARGDLGASLVSGRPVSEVLSTRLPNTLAVVAVAIAVIAVVGVSVGLAAGMQAGAPVDRLLSAGAVVLIAIPDFLLATALLVVIVEVLGLVPGLSLLAPGERAWQHPQVMLLPVASLVLGGLGVTTRLVRAGAAAVAATAPVEQARLNGERGVWLALRHVLPNSTGPAVQTLAITAAGLLGGGIVVETLFSFPGIGYELTRAVAFRDVPVVQGLSLALGGCALLVLLAGDLLARALDPRSRPSRRSRAGQPVPFAAQR